MSGNYCRIRTGTDKLRIQRIQSNSAKLPRQLTQAPRLLLTEKENMRTKILALLLCFAIIQVSSAIAKDDCGYNVMYDGGSLPGLKAGKHLKLYIESNQIRIMDDKTLVTTLVPSTVQDISYGQDVHRRIGAAIGLAVISLGIGGLMALTKSKKHYVGLTWVDGDKKGGFAMQCDKNEYRGILAALEGVSGKKAVNSDAMTVKN